MPEEVQQMLGARNYSDEKHAVYPYDDRLENWVIKTPSGKGILLNKVADYKIIDRPYGDTMDGVDADYAAKLTALNAITLAGMAGAPPFPAGVEASGAVQASAKLKWEKPSGKAVRKSRRLPRSLAAHD